MTSTDPARDVDLTEIAARAERLSSMFVGEPDDDFERDARALCQSDIAFLLARIAALEAERENLQAYAMRQMEHATHARREADHANDQARHYAEGLAEIADQKVALEAELAGLRGALERFTDEDWLMRVAIGACRGALIGHGHLDNRDVGSVAKRIAKQMVGDARAALDRLATDPARGMPFEDFKAGVEQVSHGTQEAMRRTHDEATDPADGEVPC